MDLFSQVPLGSFKFSQNFWPLLDWKIFSHVWNQFFILKKSIHRIIPKKIWFHGTFMWNFSWNPRSLRVFSHNHVVKFFAVCGYGYSRLNFHSQTVSRLDLPTLFGYKKTWYNRNQSVTSSDSCLYRSWLYCQSYALIFLSIALVHLPSIHSSKTFLTLLNFLCWELHSK